MAPRRPDVISNGDTIEIRLTNESDFRIPYTFVEALNEGTLFDRPPRIFEKAASERRLFQIDNRGTDCVIGSGIIQESGHDHPGVHRKYEVGGLMVHPAARGFGLATLLVKIMMVHEFIAHPNETSDEEFVAHVVDGNEGPVHTLLSDGFRPTGEIMVHADEIDGRIGHMIPDGLSGVPMQGYLFDKKAIDSLICGLRDFVHEEKCLLEHDGVCARFDFSTVVDPAYLEARLESLREEGRVPPPAN
jgi:GNAT superfamily N-acetyltransferase